MLIVEVMIMGSQGSGKTSTARRLRAWFQNRNARDAVRLVDGEDIEGPEDAPIVIRTVQKDI